MKATKRSPPQSRPAFTRDEDSSGTVSSLPFKAFELLASQPVSLLGLSKARRDCIVISAVIDGDGREHVVSRFGDSTWDLTSDEWPLNTPASGKRIDWPRGNSEPLVDDIKAALYCWIKRGRGGAAPPVASTVVGAGKQTAKLILHLRSLGVEDFSRLRPLQLSDYISELSESHESGSIVRRLILVDLVWCFNTEVFHSLEQDPWVGDSLSNVCGNKRAARGSQGPSGLCAKTPIIPPSVQSVLFAFGESVLDGAGKLFQERDSGFGGSGSFALSMVRNAVMFFLEITSGMRNSEAVGVKKGSWRTEIREGVTFHWVKTREYKNNLGLVEYLVPYETISALTQLEKYAKPLQDRIRHEIIWLESEISKPAGNEELPEGMTRLDAMQRLEDARESVDCLFLGLSKKHRDHTGMCRVEVMSNAGSNDALQAFAKAARVSWKLANHQCRRTYAWTVANSRIGRNSLVFLKWQLKHTSISTTQLYAANPNQDAGLYGLFYDELIAAKCEVMESWLDEDEPLSGGAGQLIVQMRATALKDRASLLRLTAETAQIRGTGHSWCLAEGANCVGEGIYEAIRCAHCSDGVIDRSLTSTWQGIHLHNLQLRALEDCGPAVLQRAEQAIADSEKVLRDLGIQPVSASVRGTLA